MNYIISIDQSTSATKAVVFNEQCQLVCRKNVPHKQYYPKPGWVEHDAEEIYRNMVEAVREVVEATKGDDITYTLAITNQRETLVVWEKETGRPLYNAIVWCDNRNAAVVDDLIREHGGANAFVSKTGLPLSPYFTATKLLWLRLNEPVVQSALNEGTCLIGTIDTWVTWCLTGGHTFVTDVTNASRTFLMNINTLEWDSDLLKMFETFNNGSVSIGTSYLQT